MRSLTRKNATAASAVVEIKSLLDTQGGVLRNPELANSLIGYESLSQEGFESLNATADGLFNKIKNTGFVRGLVEQANQISDVYARDARLSQIDIGVESATQSILVAANKDTIRSMLSKQYSPGSSKDIAVVDGSLFGIQDNAYAIESFDPYVDTQYIALQAAALILANIESDFKSTFFTPVPVAPGQSGIDFDINIQRVWQGQTASTDGKAQKFVREKIIKALIDPEFLNNEYTTIVPFAVDATTPVMLVPESVIPAWTRNIKGTTVNTRPILFNLPADQKVDLIGISNFPGLINTGVFNQTDSLDAVVNVGTVYFQVSVNNDGTITSAILEFDLINQPGSLFVQRIEARRQELISVMDARLIISPKTVAKVGDINALCTALGGALGVTPGDNFSVTAVASINSKVDIENRAFSSDCAANSVYIANAYDKNANALSVAALNTAPITTTITPIGVLPLARRTNSNLRMRGTIVDDTVVNRYRLSLKLGQPFITMRQVNTEPRTTVESLAQVVNIWNEAAAVDAFLAAEKYIDSIRNLPADDTSLDIVNNMIGSEFYIKPTLIRSTLDVNEMVVSLGSDQALQNLNGQLRAALTQLASQMLIESNYYAALRYVTGTDNGYEIIMVTDPEIATYIWESGDDRTLGNLQNYVITKHINKNFRGKIRMSVRRLNRPAPHPIDFGVQLIGVPVTQEVTLQYEGATFTENRFIPNVTFWPTLPVMAVMDVVGLETLFANNLVQ